MPSSEPQSPGVPAVRYEDPHWLRKYRDVSWRREMDAAIVPPLMRTRMEGDVRSIWSEICWTGRSLLWRSEKGVRVYGVAEVRCWGLSDCRYLSVAARPSSRSISLPLLPAPEEISKALVPVSSPSLVEPRYVKNVSSGPLQVGLSLSVD